MVTTDNLEYEEEDSELAEQSTIQQTKDSLDWLWGGRTDVFRVETEKLKGQISSEKWEIHVSPQLSSEVMLGISWFEKRSDIYPDLQDKKVVDIWGGFGWLPFELSSTVEELVVIDPLFSAENLEEFLAEDIGKMERLISQSTATMSEIKQKLALSYTELDKYMDYMVTNPSSRQTVTQISSKIQELAGKQKLLSRNIESKRLVLKQLKQWKNNFPSNVILNGSSWEDIGWMKKWDSDIVFMNNVLSKKGVDSIKVFYEALDLISIDGQIVIVDQEIDENLRLLLENNGIKAEKNGRNMIFHINKRDIKVS